MNEESKKLRESLATITKSLEKIKADMGDMEDGDKMEEMRTQMMNEMYSAFSSIMKYVYSVEDQLWSYQSQHAKGHLPPIKGASQMQSVLETLGMDGDYEVYKPVISVASTKKGTTFTLDIGGKDE